MSKARKNPHNYKQDEFSFCDDNYLIYNNDLNTYQDIDGKITI